MTRLDRVVVVGTGLIGTSVALALRKNQIQISLADRDPNAVRQAMRMGAGEPLTEQDSPADLAVLAVPPSSVAEVLLAAQHAGIARVYTDVASVKAPVVVRARQLNCDLASFVPGHPLAGGHQSGPGAARADLFVDRAWALCPAHADPAAVETVSRAVELMDASVCLLDAHSHDQGVALSSHAPHVVSSVLAARFAEADPLALQLAGAGVLDTTRIAAGDVDLWTDILSDNALSVAEALTAVSNDLCAITACLRAIALNRSSNPAALRALLEQGNHGRAQLLAGHGPSKALTG